jgi:PilZ domain-containing protein
LGIGKQPDRRQFGRRPVFKAAVVVQADGRRLAGFILDFSDAGARIKISKPALVEKEFYLEIPDDDLIVKCRVIHVDDVSVGVKYIKPPRRISWLSR